MILCITALSKMTLSIMSLSIMMLAITTLSIQTLRITIFSINSNKGVTQNNINVATGSLC
jgi:hypothetical protein